jgi:hypothetical protein
MNYDSTVGAGIQLSLYSPAGWAPRRDRTLNPDPRAATITKKSISVLGRDATLISAAVGERPINGLVVVVELGDTTIVVATAAGGNPTPGGPELNPLIDENTFLDVLQNLRPYPQ